MPRTDSAAAVGVVAAAEAAAPEVAVTPTVAAVAANLLPRASPSSSRPTSRCQQPAYWWRTYFEDASSRPPALTRDVVFSYFVIVIIALPTHGHTHTHDFLPPLLHFVLYKFFFIYRASLGPIVCVGEEERGEEGETAGGGEGLKDVVQILVPEEGVS